MDLEKYISENGILEIKVVPNSDKTEIIGELESGILKLKARGIPEKGKVNNEVIKFFSKKLEIEKSKIKIISGETSRKKLLKIEKD